MPIQWLPHRLRGVNLAAVALLTASVGCTWQLPWPPHGGTNSTLPNSPHLGLGNPSDASAQPDNYLLLRPQYALSYNRTKGIPNWASWQLEAAAIGNTPRQENFQPDEQLPPSWPRVQSKTYSGSGYDRGHLVPARDRSDTVANSAATFVMTNVLPQAPDNNQGPWERLESYCRDLAQQGKRLHILAGGYGQQKMLPGKPQVAVPSHLWKVVVVTDANQGGRSPSTHLLQLAPTTRVIAVIIPNTQGILQVDWRNYRTTVRTIEAKTGYNLLSHLPDDLEQQLETQTDQIWDQQTPRHRDRK
jgi:endonuclease G, mitochondrial